MSAPGTAGGPWTDAEIALLLEAARTENGWIEAAAKALPHRTRAAIQVQGSARGARDWLYRPPAPALPVVERVGVIRGHRIWRAVWNGRDAVLRSIWTGEPWLVGRPFETGEIEQRPKSDGGLRNGVHAFKALRKLSDYGYDLPKLDGEAFVDGTVSLWGRVIEHERGYRAQFAYPQFICTCAGVELARAIARSYGIETGRCADGVLAKVKS